MEIIHPVITCEADREDYAKFVVTPLERGFGLTLGNSLRRILLSALPGAAAVGIKIAGVAHEFSAIKGIKEEVTEIILNLKQVRFKAASALETEGKVVCSLYADKVGAVKAGDIKCAAGVEVVNKDQVICTLDDDAVLDMVIYVAYGRGYVQAKEHKDEKEPIGYIPIDSIYTPVLKVNSIVEPARVGQSIDFDKLTLEVTTDGTVSAKEITSLAAKVLKDHADLFVNLTDIADGKSIFKKEEQESSAPDILSDSIMNLDLSARSQNCLVHANIRTIGELVAKTEDDMMKVRNLGRKSLDEIIKKLESMGLTLKELDD